MKTSVTAAVLGLFALTCAVYFYMVPLDRAALQKAVPKKSMKILPPDEKTPIKTIQIQNLEKNETILLVKNGNLWEINYPIRYPAESMLAEGLVTALKLSSRARRLLPEKDWAEYGLLKPKIKVGIETEGNARRRYLYFGDSSAVGPYVFARWEEDPEYFLVSQDLKAAFTKSLYALRLKQVFRTQLQDIKKLRIRTPSQEYEVEKRGEEWFWLEPIPLLGQKFSKKRADELVAQFSGLFVKEFMDGEKKQEREMGFTLLTPWVKLWSGDSKKESEEIRIGQELASRDSFVARRTGEQVYFLIARNNVRSLFQMFETFAEEARAPEPKAEPAPVQTSAVPAAEPEPEAEAVDLKAQSETKTQTQASAQPAAA